ncbi:MAG: hypothetical protein ACLUOL_03155 [Faecalibacterium sp.]
MLKQAVEVVIAGQASTSRCSAAAVMPCRPHQDDGRKGHRPLRGAKPRAVLISRQQWLEMR